LHQYTTYGLHIDSEIVFPELLPGEQSFNVRIRLASIDVPPPSGKRRISRKVTPDEAILFWENVGALQIRNGNEIIADPLPEVEERVLRLFILGAGLAVLLHQRGYLILHASAVSVKGHAVCFLGNSGAGKSTMAAAMHDRGHHLVADDIVAVQTRDDGLPLVYAGFPQLKIWPELLDILKHVPDELPQLHPHLEKRGLRVPEGFPQGSLPLGCLYVLKQVDQVENEIVPIPPQEALIELVRLSFIVGILERTGTSARHFKQSSSLVNQIPICRLIRQKSLPDLPALARLVEVDAIKRITHLDG
jgi:energy-coupling factor transporter ATP-binding protein EcfA2